MSGAGILDEALSAQKGEDCTALAVRYPGGVRPLRVATVGGVRRLIKQRRPAWLVTNTPLPRIRREGSTQGWARQLTDFSGRAKHPAELPLGHPTTLRSSVRCLRDLQRATALYLYAGPQFDADLAADEIVTAATVGAHRRTPFESCGYERIFGLAPTVRNDLSNGIHGAWGARS